MSKPVQVVIPGLDAWHDGEKWRMDEPPPRSPVDQVPPTPGLRENAKTKTRSQFYQWVETYQSKDYQYYRYCWQMAPKDSKGDPGPIIKRHIPGGNTGSPLAKANRQIVMDWIQDNRPPLWIVGKIQEFPREC